MRTAKALAGGDLSRRASVNGADELAQLASSLNEMRDSIGRQISQVAAQRQNLVSVLDNLREGVIGLDDGGPADADRLIRAVFSGIAVVNTYVPQGFERESPKFAYKLEWFKRLRKFFAKHYKPDQMLLWCGDINVAREEIDVHNPKRLLGHVDFTPEVWEGFDHVRDWGFVDVFRKHHPGEPGQYSFFDYRVPKSVERGLGWRVDHILATAPLAKKSVDCHIDLEPRKAEKPSDHTPIVAEFKL